MTSSLSTTQVLPFVPGVAFFFGTDSGYFKYYVIFLDEFCKPYLPIIFCGKIKSYLGLYYTKYLTKFNHPNLEKVTDSY